jgi:hypothetical protein
VVGAGQHEHKRAIPTKNGANASMIRRRSQAGFFFGGRAAGHHLGRGGSQ